MIDKNLIFYFVRRIRNGFPDKWKEKLKKVRVIVNKDAMVFSDIDGKPEVMGAWYEKIKLVEYFLSAIVNYFATKPTFEEGLKSVESVVEHELLHAVGLDHKGIEEYRKKKVAGAQAEKPQPRHDKDP